MVLSDLVEPSLRRRAIWMLMVTAFLWSSSGLFVKLLSWGPLAIWGVRSLVATAVFWLYFRPQKLRWTRLQLVGALGYMGAQLFFIMGNKIAPTANIIFLSYTAPVYIILLGYWVLGERPLRGDWLTMPIIFAGMLLFFGDDLSFGAFRGNVLGVLSGLSMAVMVLSMRRQKAANPGHTILLGNILGALIGLPFAFGEPLTVTSVGIILYLGVFQIGLSFILYSFAIKQLEALESTLLLTLEPILSPLWVFLVLGEVPGPLATAGAALVLLAVVLRAVLSARTAVPPAAPVANSKV